MVVGAILFSAILLCAIFKGVTNKQKYDEKNSRKPGFPADIFIAKDLFKVGYT